MTYDPLIAPEPSAWLALPDAERLRRVEAYHENVEPKPTSAKPPNAKLHSVVHVTVENQLAEGFGPTVRAMARLHAGGLDRHEALHAIGTVLSHHIFGAMKLGAQQFDEGLYAMELELLKLERR
jgi:hypothetical protein